MFPSRMKLFNIVADWLGTFSRDDMSSFRFIFVMVDGTFHEKEVTCFLLGVIRMFLKFVRVYLMIEFQHYPSRLTNDFLDFYSWMQGAF